MNPDSQAKDLRLHSVPRQKPGDCSRGSLACESGKFMGIQ